MENEIFIKIASVAITAAGGLIMYFLKSLKDDIKDLKKDIKDISTDIKSIDRRITFMEGENNVSKNVMLSLITKDPVKKE